MAIKAKKLQPAKTAAIEEAKKVLGEYNNFIFVDYRGLTVEQITKLRGSLREKDSQLKVIKNNFARVAFEEMNPTLFKLANNTLANSLNVGQSATSLS